jgi:hypothetical protein
MKKSYGIWAAGNGNDQWFTDRKEIMISDE